MKYLLLLIFSLSLSAATLEEAESLKRTPGTQEKAAEIYLEYAIQGNSHAMIELGKLFIYGEGMQKDCKKGIIYFFSSVSSEEPDFKGYLELSNLFKRGICVNQSDEKASKYRKIYNEKTKRF